MAKGGVVTEEQVIARAQYLDLIYTQSSTLYDKIMDAPRPAFTFHLLLNQVGTLMLVTVWSLPQSRKPQEFHLVKLLLFLVKMQMKILLP